MKKIKLVLGLLLLFGIMPLTTGCGNGNGDEYKEVEIIKNKESQGIVDDFSDQLFLNGKQVRVPTTLDELGDEYTFGDKDMFIDFQKENGVMCTQGELFYKDEVYARVTLYNTNKEIMNENTTIYEIRFEYSLDGDFALQTLKKGASRAEVDNVLGKPTIENEGILQYFNEKDNNEERKLNRILVHMRDEKMSYFIVTKVPQE